MKQYINKIGGVEMNVNILKSKIALKGITIDELAEQIGISKTAMYRRLNGTNSFKANEIKAMKTILSLDMNEVSDIFFSDEVA